MRATQEGLLGLAGRISLSWDRSHNREWLASKRSEQLERVVARVPSPLCPPPLYRNSNPGGSRSLETKQNLFEYLVLYPSSIVVKHSGPVLLT